MWNVIRTEFCRFRQSCCLWVILGVLLLGPAIAVWLGNYGSVEACFLNLIRDPMPLMLSIAVYAGISVSADFSDKGIIPYYLMSGYEQRQILPAILLRYLTGTLLLAILYPLLSVLHALFFLPLESDAVLFLAQAGIILLQGLPLMLGISLLFFTVSVLIRHTGISTGIGVALSIFLTMFGNQLYFSSGDSAVPSLRFFPLIQYQLIGRGKSIPIEYLITIGITILLSVILLGTANIVLHRREY
ncbi:MAG: hypothetical protein ACOX6P_11905 [Candidatus Merdivicinus sp.]|jgi:hypothetical protein